MDKNNNMIWSVALSMALLITFFTLHQYDAKILSLEFKWVMVAGIPLLIGLLYSGIIKSFKGFGIELETEFSESVKQIEIIGELIPLESPEMTKESMNVLYEMNDNDKKKIERLSFINGKRDYYNNTVISEYLNHLPNLKFIEINETGGEYNCLVPTTNFRPSDGNILYGEVDKLINSIENKSVLTDFENSTNSYLNEDDSLVQAYQTIVKPGAIEIGNDKVLPVINKSKKLIGLVSKIKLEEKISKQVIHLIEKK